MAENTRDTTRHHTSIISRSFMRKAAGRPATAIASLKVVADTLSATAAAEIATGGKSSVVTPTPTPTTFT